MVFLCNVNTSRLDPELDFLDMTFKLGDTVMMSYTALDYDELPIRLEGLRDFSEQYNDDTKDQKFDYTKKVNIYDPVF